MFRLSITIKLIIGEEVPVIARLVEKFQSASVTLIIDRVGVDVAVRVVGRHVVLVLGHHVG